MPNIMKEYEKYYLYHQEYTKKYGPKTVVLMQIGKFYEIYEYTEEINGKEVTIGMCHQFQRVLALSGEPMNISKLKGSGYPVSKNNPYKSGFPKDKLDRWKTTVLDAGYTLVIINEVGWQLIGKKKSKKRKVTQVLTRNMDIDRIRNVLKPITNNIVSLIIDVYKPNLRPELSNLTCGIALINLITGKVVCDEYNSKKFDPCYPLSRINRILSVCPKELIINIRKAPDGYFNYISRELSLHSMNQDTILVRNNVIKDYFKNSYQSTFLRKVYPKASHEQIQKQGMLVHGTAALISLLDYCNEHNEDIVKGAQFPKLYENEEEKYLYVSKSTITQLNIFDSHYLDKRNEYKSIDSLLSILDRTRTVMGRRYLVKRFRKPYIDQNKIIASYDLIEEFITYRGELYEPIRKLLSFIPDLESLHSRIKSYNIKPRDMHRLLTGYIHVDKIYDIINKVKDKHGAIFIPELPIKDKERSIFNEVYKFLYETLDTRGCRSSRVDIDFIESDTPIFKNIISGSTLFNLDSHRELWNKNLSKWIINYDKIIEFTKKIQNITDYKSTIFYKSGSLYVLITKTAYNKLIKTDHGVKIEQIKGFKPSYFVYTDEIKESCKILGECRHTYQYLQYKIYQILLKSLNNDYIAYFKPLIGFIAKIDFSISAVWCALKYKYMRPEIVSGEVSNFKVKGLRHPIVERIIDQEYITNDLDFSLKEKARGMLLFGCNSSGKTTLARAIGTLIMMAQVGYFVPAETLSYTPYHHIVTRLTGNDDQFKGSSSFVVEIDEVKTILQYANKNSLILGDELCRGTGMVDATGISIVTFEELIKLGCTFLFSTHMHHLVEQPEIKKFINNDSLLIKHLGVSCDINKDLVYNRKLQDGRGKTHYGIEVAKSRGLPDEFIKRCYSVRKRLLIDEKGGDGHILSLKKSRYSSKVYVDECLVCGSKKNLETHHIREQKYADKFNFIGSVPKNAPYNIPTLCKTCHDKITYRGHEVKKEGGGYVLINNSVSTELSNGNRK